MKKLVIFDLDGTLLDTLYDINFCINYALKQLALPTITMQETKDHVCNGLQHLVNFACDKQALHPIITKIFSEISVENAYKNTFPYEGILDLLKQLKSKNVQLALLTNKRHWQADVLYERFFAQFDFLAVYGHRVGIPLKPDPTSLLNMLEEFRFKKEEVVLVGDGDTDALTAKNANVDFVGVTWGYCDKQVLQNVGAKNFINTPKELLKYL